MNSSRNTLTGVTSSTWISIDPLAVNIANSKNNMTRFAKYFALTLCAFTLNPAMPQPLPEMLVVRDYDEVASRGNYNLLMERFGRNKILPPGYELQALLALSHYPELQEVRVEFIVDDVSIPLSSRPHWPSLWRSAKKRLYRVYIDSHREGSRGALLLKNQPFNAQVGILGHELAHTVYYLDRSFFGILQDAICQLSDCAVEFERATDRRLIDYGLGWQRFDHSSFVRGGYEANRRITRLPAMDAETPMDDGRSYVGPDVLLFLMRDHPRYRSFQGAD